MAYNWIYENSVSQTKEYQEDLSEYSAWRMNRNLAGFSDTILYANEMNLNASLDAKMQYDYLFHSIRKGRRFSKKRVSKEDSNFALINDVYKYSAARTREVLRVLTQAQIDVLRKRQEEKGG